VSSFEDLQKGLDLSGIKKPDAWIELVDKLEKAFEACDHRFSDMSRSSWCNLCGAKKIATNTWIKPHWRDILLRALQPS
jgi:hypothetical protein